MIKSLQRIACRFQRNMANANFVHFLKQKSLQRKFQEAELYDDLGTFFLSQRKEEEEVVPLISYGLVEPCDNTKLM